MVSDWNYCKQAPKFFPNITRKTSIPQVTEWDETELGMSRNKSINNNLNYRICIYGPVLEIGVILNSVRSGPDQGLQRSLPKRNVLHFYNKSMLN